MNVHREFLIMGKGIFEPENEYEKEGLLMVKVVGWGQDMFQGDPEPYWLVESLFGESWGD